MIFGKKQEKEQSKLEKRVSNMATADLITWAESAMFTIGRNLRSPNKLELEEAVMGAEALQVVAKELLKRR